MTMTPVAVILLSELSRLKGSATDRELYENVKKATEAVGIEISRNDFMKLLMTLELRGYIRVEGIKKNSRMVHLVKTGSR